VATNERPTQCTSNPDRLKVLAFREDSAGFGRILLISIMDLVFNEGETEKNNYGTT
jgi:hypothetical protein